MPDHEITHATGEAEYSIVWEDGWPQVGHTTNRRSTYWHCKCGQKFGSQESAANHVGRGREE